MVPIGEAQPSQAGSGHGGDAAKFSGQMLACDGAAIGCDGGTLQNVAQFAHISGPGVGLEEFHNVGANAGDFFFVFSGDVGEQVVHQQRQIFFVLAQRWKMDVENVQSEIEVLAQVSVGDRLFGIFVGGGDDARRPRAFRTLLPRRRTL